MKFVNQTRQEMYRYIERDVKDDEFKDEFKECVERKIEDLNNDIQEQYEIIQKDFTQNIKDDLKRYEEHLQGIVQNISCNKIEDSFGNTLEFNMDSGIDKTALVASISALAVLAVINWWNPVGWFTLVSGIIVGALGVYKSIRKFFSSSYGMSEQKKTTNENLDKIKKALENDMEKQLNANKEKIYAPINAIKNELEKPVKDTENIIAKLTESKKELEKIANHIKGEMK